MASNERNLSRRETLVGIALCGATAATPVAAASIAKAQRQPDRREWDRTMREYEAAKVQAKVAGDRMDTAADTYASMTGQHPHKEGTCRPLDPIIERTSGYRQASDLAEVCEEREYDLSTRLVLLPAPDTAALMWKLEYLYGAEVEDDDDFASAWCKAFVAAVMSDARRLLSHGRA